MIGKLWELFRERCYGRILCFNDDDIFGYARDPQHLCNSSLLEYRLYPQPEA